MVHSLREPDLALVKWMSLDKPIHLIVFAVLVGVVAYFSSALWSAIFIVSLPMDADAIIDSVEVETGENESKWYPTEFKNSLEEGKYYHNRRMRDRNRYWVFGQLIIGGLVGVFAFYVVPKWRSKLDGRYEPPAFVIGGIIVGVLTVLMIPFLLRCVLPAPIHWFPQELVNISESREREALERLKRIAD